MIMDLKPISWDKTKMHGKKIWGSSFLKICGKVVWNVFILYHCVYTIKVLHRLHYSRNKLSKLFRTDNPGCPRCSCVPAATGHMFWSCTSLIDYWRQIIGVFSKLCGQTVAPNYHTAIFGVPPPGCKVSNLHTNVLAFASLLAHRFILFNWKSNLAPLFLQWFRDNTIFPTVRETPMQDM